MIQLTSREIDDLEYCKRELERVLSLLDRVGAGIAAIHVNAAVEQLDMNMEVIGPQSCAIGSSLLFPEDNA